MMENILMRRPVLVPDHGAAASVHAESLKVGCEFGVLQENPAQPWELPHEDGVSEEASRVPGQNGCAATFGTSGSTHFWPASSRCHRPDLSPSAIISDPPPNLKVVIAM